MLKRYNISQDIIVLAILLFIAPFFFQNDFIYEIAIVSLLNALICVGLNMLMGYAGQVSLGHGAFAGLGGYIAVILSSNYGISPLFSIFIAIVTMAIFAFIISKPILKLRGHYLAMATLGVGIIISIVLNVEDELTGGSDGMSVDSFSVFGYEFTDSLQWYILCAVLLIFTIWMFKNLINSPFGRVLKSIEGSQKAANSVGINVSHYKSVVFVISVVIATLAGSLYAFFSGFISPSEASFSHSIELVVMVVLGGLGRVYGAIIGAVILTILPQLLTSFEDYQTLIYGAIIIFVMMFMPKGIASLFDDIKRRLFAQNK
ncbi:MAG: branched-chain amino acid ABC transporter permease [Epsilonproteobacteria bacterium]|nr:branched-chain amino acid ABC transporter permease [Campylobacterota bacterium]